MNILYAYRNKLTPLVHKAIIQGFSIPLSSAVEISQIKNLDLSVYDFVIIFGVISRKAKVAAENAGVKIIFIDKSHIRLSKFRHIDEESFFRITIDSWNPFRHYKTFEDRQDRGKAIRTYNGNFPDEIKPFNQGSKILFAGSSEKYHKYHNLSHPTEYAKSVMKEVKKYTDMEIVYRPKRTWRGKEKICGSEWEGDKRLFSQVLKKVHPYCVITHGSNCCIDSLYSGYPTLILGDAATKPISSTKIEDINSLYLATKEEKHKLSNSIGCFNWKLKEMSSGEMLTTLNPILEKEL